MRDEYDIPRPEAVHVDGPACSECNSTKSFSAIAAEEPHWVERLRTCLDCGHQWETVELPEDEAHRFFDGW